MQKLFHANIFLYEKMKIMVVLDSETRGTVMHTVKANLIVDDPRTICVAVLDRNQILLHRIFRVHHQVFNAL